MSYSTINKKLIATGIFIIFFLSLNNLFAARIGLQSATVSGAPTTICAGNSVLLSLNVTTCNGGGGGQIWNDGTETYLWESSANVGGPWTSTGGTNSTYNASPISNTYYRCKITVNSSTNCGTFGGATYTTAGVLVTVNPIATSPTSVSASSNPICSGNSTTLSYVGGSGTTFRWYTGSCGGTLVGSGNNLSVSPASTTTYYGAWENGCGLSSCKTVTVTVNTVPTAPTSVSASVNPLCSGNSTVLSYTGGSGTTFRWYTSSCGGTLVGSGNNLSVSPGTTTTYYGRWESSCGNSTCQTVTVTVQTAPTPPTSVSATVNPTCSGSSTTLSYTGGSGTTFRWYTGSCGGTLIGSGNNLSVSPASTTTYYGAWEVGCGISSCQTVSVTVNNPPSPAANAGTDQTPATSTTNLAGNTPTVGTGTWTCVTNCGGVGITSPNSPTSQVTGLTAGVSTTFRWTISNPPCTPTQDDVIITYTIGATKCPTSTSVAPVAAQTKCVGDGGNLLTATITTSGGSGTPTLLYQWYYNTTNSNTVAGANLIAGATNSTYTPLTTLTEVGSRWYFCVGYATDNGCGQTNATQSLASNTVQVTVNNVPDVPAAISGPPSVGPASAASYSIAAVAGATSYTWTVPVNWTINSGQTTTSINVTSGNVGDNGNITVTASNLCGTSAARILAVACVNSADHSLVNCNGCHLLHSSPGVTLTSANGNALLCQTCHISGGTAQNKPLPNSDMSNIGSGTGNSHAWGVAAVNATMGAVLPTNPDMLSRVEGGTTIICSTCHNQHNGAVASPHLRADNTNDAICKDCHSVRDVGLYTDDPANNRGSHPIDINYNDADPRFNNTQTLIVNGQPMLCSTCHSIHDVNDNYNAVSDGNLLRMANDASICEDCHIPMNHNGMNCRDCHDTHDPSKTNIYMIKQNIGTGVIFTSRGTDAGPAGPAANSYADGDGTYNGICEVCHTTTAHFRKDGSAPDQNHASSGGPMNGKNCMACHPHGSAFTPSGGTCTGCHASAQPGTYGRGGALQIVGVGGEFEPSPLTSRHTELAPTDADCEKCHYSASSHPTNQKQLRDVDLVDTEWLGDVDVYCLKCHDGTPPAGVTFSAAVTDPDKSGYNLAINHNCLGCHERHGSTFADLLKASTNYTLCRTCHNGGTAVNIDVANIATPGSPGTGNTHAWGVSASSGLYQTNSPTNPAISARLDGGNMVCKTCHDPHNSNTKFTVIDNSANAMCKDCHSVRDVGRYADDPVNNKGSHPVGVNYSGTGNVKPVPTGSVVTVGGKVECSSCHQTHNSTSTDGNLLRQTNDATLCTDCHTYSSHQGQGCKVCHDSHGTGTNIYLIRNTVTTPSSGNKTVVFSNETLFADGNGTYDGICEVCHTTTKHHKNTNDGHNHKDGTNCTTCHTHANNFSPVSCTQCHNSAQGAKPIINGAGGQFIIPPKVSNHAAGSDATSAECEACHYPVNGAASHMNNGGVAILKNPDAAAAWTGDKDNYCMACHDGTPAVDKKTTYLNSVHDNSYTNSCAMCHTEHGSTNSKLLIANTNYLVCRTCHDGAPGTNIDVANMVNVAGTTGNSHAWDVSASSGKYQTNAPTLTAPGPIMTARLSGGNIVCNTCHDPHDNTKTKFLVADNSADAMCKNCHSARNLGRYVDNITNNKGSHPVGLAYVPGGNYQNPAPVLSSTQVGLKGGKIECSSCHSTHNSTTNNGKLLRENMTSTVCKDCHTYKTHQTFDCMDCHQTHNGTNIMLIKSAVNTKTVVFNSQGTDAVPVQVATKSFSDGDATRDGICEVCHTTTAYHKGNVDDGTNHYDGKKCTGCHAHNDATTSFPKPNCVACHDAIPGHTTNAHATHTTGQYSYDCSFCHLNQGSGGSSEPTHPSGGAGEVTLNTANPLVGATATYNSVAKTCSNVYCHSNGQGTFTTTPSFATGTITTCSPCHVQNISVVPTYLAPSTGAHAQHYGTQYQYICSTCHNGLSNTSATHVDGTKDVIFNPTGLATRNGADSNTPAYNTGTKVCTNVYCHSNGVTADRGGDAEFPSWGSLPFGTVSYATTPSWSTGSITVCTSCHGGKGVMTSPYDISPPGPITGNTSSDYPQTGSHGPNRAAHNSNSQNLSGNGYSYVQCYWCHEVDSRVSTGAKKQGTYGTTLHADGQTHFKPKWFSNGGTMVNTITYSSEGSAGHCGNGKTCW